MSDKVSVAYVTPEDVSKYWPLAAPHIRRAQKLIEQNVSMEDIFEDLVSGGGVLWLILVGDTLKASGITTLIKHPRRRVMRIQYLGGDDMDEWLDESLQQLAGIAKAAGLEAIETEGRFGWKRRVKGFRPTFVKYEMELL